MIYVLVMVMTTLSSPKRTLRSDFQAYRTVKACEDRKKYWEQGTDLIVKDGKTYITYFECEAHKI